MSSHHMEAAIADSVFVNWEITNPLPHNHRRLSGVMFSGSWSAVSGCPRGVQNSLSHCNTKCVCITSSDWPNEATRHLVVNLFMQLLHGGQME